MKVELDKDVAEDLISYKLRSIQKQITNILKRWNESDSSAFLVKAKNGTYSEAEMDAITMRQLIADYHKLRELLDSVTSGEKK